MPSPFPGMDPFIEGRIWADFHADIIPAIREYLIRAVRPRYVVRVEERVYLDHQPEVYLALRDPETLDVITVVEVLSPTNKRPGGDGRKEYLNKREAVLLSGTNLVELDLLRGGRRLPTLQPLPPADYYAVVCRERFRPQAEAYPWRLRQRLPTIPVPLAGDDADVQLDLRAVFDTVYDRAGYDYFLSYRGPVDPPLEEEDAAWVQEVRAAAAASQSR